uniref:Uncharacterized protein n=1 Tax=Rhizophora mucronata TaxID=61149 RepID=A0A2P2NCU4_RHIMU
MRRKENEEMKKKLVRTREVEPEKQESTPRNRNREKIDINSFHGTFIHIE